MVGKAQAVMEEEDLLREAGATTCYQPSSTGHWLPIPRAFLLQMNPSLPRCPAVTTQSLIFSGILLPSLAHIPAQIGSPSMCPAHVIHLWDRSCLLSCVTGIQQGPKKPSHIPKTTTEEGKLGAPSCFSVPPPTHTR